MSCMDVQLPPARLQTQGVQAGERDAEQTGEGKTSRRTEMSRNKLVPATRSHQGRPCATGAAL